MRQHRACTLPPTGRDRANGPGGTPYLRPAVCGQVRPDHARITFCGCRDGAFVRCAVRGRGLEWEVNSAEERDDDCSTGVRCVGRTDAHNCAGSGPLAASKQWRGVRSRCCTGGASARTTNQEQARSRAPTRVTALKVKPVQVRPLPYAVAMPSASGSPLVTTGRRSATVIITDNATGSPQNAPLSGHGSSADRAARDRRLLRRGRART